MTISPVNFNGMLQRTDDVGQIKHQEDAKPLVDQQNIQTTVEKQEQAVLHNVNDPNESGQTDTSADAREEGKGTYFDNRRKKAKKEEEETKDGHVIRKSMGGSFDIKI